MSNIDAIREAARAQGHEITEAEAEAEAERMEARLQEGGEA